MDPETVAMMEELANEKLPTADDKFEMLLKYVHPDVQFKDTMIDEVMFLARTMTREEKFEYFVAAMQKATTSLPG